MSDDSEPIVEPPVDMLAGRPETAYFWGFVAGAGEVSSDGISITTTDEDAAERLAAIAGVGDGSDDGTIAQATRRREYAHDASITRTEDEYTVAIEAESGAPFGRGSVASLPVDGQGNYRFDAFSSHGRELLRGLLEGCGTVCFKRSSGTVGVSFVHDDRALLETVRELIVDCPVDAPLGDLSETSSGGYWFGVDDDAASAFGQWVYDDCEATGCFAPTRRRKLERSLEEAAAYDGG